MSSIVSSAAAASNLAGGEDTIPLITNDQQRFDVPKKIAFNIKLIKNQYEDDSGDAAEFPLNNMNSGTLTRVLEFLNKYEERPMWEIEKPLKTNNMKDLVQDWYADFVMTKYSHDEVYELLEAAHFYDIPPLLDLTCAYVATLIKGRTPEEIRTNFGVVSDFTPEESAWLREENKWALDEKSA